MRYQNGNATISLDNEGTRTIEYENTLLLDFPLNIDIRVSSRCAFGLNLKTGKAFCTFCHESATTDGTECNYSDLKTKLVGLPQGIELAIGANEFTTNLYNFLSWCFDQGYICNVTINQGHLRRDLKNIVAAINDGYVKGLGISYRSSLKWDIPNVLLDYPNAVFHVIAGIDSFGEVYELKNRNVKKVLLLGEKNFGFNTGNVNLSSRKHREWYWWVAKLFNRFEAVSFDNLALEQMNIKRFFTQGNWDTFNNGEHSFYINGVDQYFAPSSRSPLRTPWEEQTVHSYFQSLNN